MDPGGQQTYIRGNWQSKVSSLIVNWTHGGVVIGLLSEKGMEEQVRWQRAGEQV